MICLFVSLGWGVDFDVLLRCGFGVFCDSVYGFGCAACMGFEVLIALIGCLRGLLVIGLLGGFLSLCACGVWLFLVCGWVCILGYVGCLMLVLIVWFGILF